MVSFWHFPRLQIYRGDFKLIGSRDKAWYLAMTLAALLQAMYFTEQKLIFVWLSKKWFLVGTSHSRKFKEEILNWSVTWQAWFLAMTLAFAQSRNSFLFGYMYQYKTVSFWHFPWSFARKKTPKNKSQHVLWTEKWVRSEKKDHLR